MCSVISKPTPALISDIIAEEALDISEVIGVPDPYK